MLLRFSPKTVLILLNLAKMLEFAFRLIIVNPVNFSLFIDTLDDK